MKAELRPNQVSIAVPVLSTEAAPQFATLSIELLGPDDKVIAGDHIVQSVATGEQTPVITLPLPSGSPVEGGHVWDRVRYQLQAGNHRLGGVVALAAIAPDLFVLRATHSNVVRTGKPFLLRVITENPVTHRPVAGVSVSASSDDLLQGPVTAMTDQHGSALLKVSTEGAKDKTLSLTVRAEKNGVTDALDADVGLSVDEHIVVQSDKLLYQPGQVVKVRALMFDADHRAAASSKIGLTITDPERAKVFQATESTNKFGIASFEWQVPANVRLGDYQITASSPGGNEDYRNEGSRLVRISRYELPEFTVGAKLDRSYYLAGQEAAVDVSAQYLFGKPVTKGGVRVVHEKERKWNFRDQKWETQEAEEIRGDLDGKGRFRALLHLGSAFDELGKYLRDDDLTYAAYVTDSASGRTEQRRFTVRISREAIHVYALRAYLVPQSQDVELVLTTYLADGTPAAADVSIEQEFPQQGPGPHGDQLLRTVHTNRYGVAKTILSLRPGSDEGTTLVFTARDRLGRTGHGSDTVEGGSRQRFLVSTDKALYRAGEPIAVSLQGPNLPRAVVDLINRDTVVSSTVVRLRGGHAFLTIPYQATFDREVTVAAYAVQSNWSGYSLPYGSHTVLYPKNNELKVTLDTGRTYRPGDDMVSTVRVARSDGGSRQSALGIVMVDKALEERIRTDNEFSGNADTWGWYRDEPQLGGVTLSQLENLDMSQPVPSGLDVAADAVLNSGYNYYRPELEDSSDIKSADEVFLAGMKKTLKPVLEVLDCQSCPLPATATEFDSFLAQHGTKMSSFLDPWGTPFRPGFDLQPYARILEITSAGPDKAFGTEDDINVYRRGWNYFMPVGVLIDRAVVQAYGRTGGYVRDYSSLRAEVRGLGVDLDQVRDPWGRPYLYEFTPREKLFTITVSTHGPTTARDQEPTTLWTSSIDYFQNARAAIGKAIDNQKRVRGTLPKSDAEFRALMSAARVDFAGLRDPWGHPYYTSFARNSEYGDMVVIEYSTLQKDKDTPVTRQLDWVYVRSAGTDGKAGTEDDFTVAAYYEVVSTQSAGELNPQPVANEAGGVMGAIGGTVLDPTGAIIPGAQVVAMYAPDGTTHSTLTDESGKFELKALQPGEYEVVVSKQGFMQSVVQHVPVHASSLTEVNVKLNVGQAAQEVMVEGTANVALETLSASVSGVSAGPQVQVKVPTFTPRVRQYFPETLYWEPSLITNGSGTARFRVKLADTVTTWKLSAFASTQDGHIGTAEREIQAFQPFFVDLNPPRVLTVGDTVAIPALARNYTEKPQSLHVAMTQERWFLPVANLDTSIDVPAGEQLPAVFSITANQASDEAPLRVTAANGTVGDAIEKQLTIHPNGEQRSASTIAFLRGAASLEIDVPANALPGTLHSEVKVYPSPVAHLMESVEAGLIRPYGCAEQTISAAYPSLLVLGYYEHESHPPAIVARARRYVEEGYGKLLGYQAGSGGFSYWGHGDDADLALTAYAVRFLTEASRFIAVDASVIEEARGWVLDRQRIDGNWTEKYGSGEMLTAYIAEALASTPLPSGAAPAMIEREQKAENRAESWLHARLSGAADPYAIAELARLEVEMHHPEKAAPLIATLLGMRHDQADGTYWEMQTNTPFYGWGLAGSIETTATVVQALHAFATATDSTANDGASDRALIFLLKQEDRYGVWYSGQGTVDVLEAILAASRTDSRGPAGRPALTVDGNRLPAPVLSTNGTGLLTEDIALNAGRNRVEVEWPGADATVQIVTTYYVPWPAGSAARPSSTRTGDSDALKLEVTYSRHQAVVGTPISCSVHAERIGFRGHGMLLAEIGLPPGAEVDRGSLEHAMKQAGWAVERYEILPDRIVLYLWPTAGGADVQFSFTPRLAMKALSSQSVLFDYYNPEALVVLPPSSFDVEPSTNKMSLSEMEDQ